MSGKAGNRALLGLLLGLALGVGLAQTLLSGARRSEEEASASRLAIVTLRSLTEVVERAGGAGDAVRKAVLAWSEARKADTAKGPVSVRVASARVVLFDGLSLEASTAPGDVGEAAAPRRLSRDEKPLYDRGQRLRAGIDTNRQEGGARKDELEVEPLAGGGLSLAAPLEIRSEAGTDKQVVGLVEIQTLPKLVGGVAPSGLGRASLLYVLLPAVLLFALKFALGERRWPLVIAAVVLCAGSMTFFGVQAVDSLAKGRRATEEGLAAAIQNEEARCRAVLATLGLPEAPALDPATWDSDSFRRPRGLVTAKGTIVEDRLAEDVARNAATAKKTLLGVSVLALLLLTFVALGGAAKLLATLRDNRTAYTYTLPAMSGMLILVFFPFFYGIALSFTDSNIYNTGKSIAETWVGFKNYIEILTDFGIARRSGEGDLVFNYLNFYWTFFVTVAWTVCNVTFGVTVGLILALILNTKGLAMRPIYRVLLILPWAMPNYITALIWKGMFHQQFGVINHVLQMFGAQPISWFEKPFSSFLTALATNGWLSFPFMMVVSLGALQSIPSELYEAARVDGASRWQQFRAITLPSLKPALVPAIILSVVWTFNMFNIIYLVTQGEPASSTEILITQAYKFAFEKYRYGYAAAYSTVIFLILLVYGTFQNRMSKATEAA